VQASPVVVFQLAMDDITTHLLIWKWVECRLVLNAVKKLPKDMIAGFYTLEARNPRTGEKIGLDIESLSGECAPLSRLRRGCGPKVNLSLICLVTLCK
jgi:hypothetical protein